jgi:hypothetical protein
MVNQSSRTTLVTEMFFGYRAGDRTAAAPCRPGSARHGPPAAGSHEPAADFVVTSLGTHRAASHGHSADPQAIT